MIELFVSDNDVTNGSIAVTWCVSTETLDLLAQEKVVDPQIVICVSPEGELYDKRKEYRKVVPLGELMTYIEFKVPGKNRISAVVSYKTKKEAKSLYLLKDDGEFMRAILDFDGEDYVDWLKEDADQVHMLSTPVYVNVPKECFAPEPPAWEKVWVNHYFRNKPIDQCNYRRRRLFAYLVQPFILLAKSVATLVLLLLATLIGTRGWSLRYLLHPLDYRLDDSIEVLFGGSIFIRTLPEDKKCYVPNVPWYLLRKLCLLPFIPLVVITIALLAYCHILLPVGLAFAGALVLVGIISFFASGTSKKFLFGFVNWVSGLFDKLPNDDLWYLRQEEMAMIVCDGRKKSASVSALPAKKRTIALRFSEIKSKVCRPFSA